jgi:hypothetical protein
LSGVITEFPVPDVIGTFRIGGIEHLRRTGAPSETGRGLAVRYYADPPT